MSEHMAGTSSTTSETPNAEEMMQRMLDLSHITTNTNVYVSEIWQRMMAVEPQYAPSPMGASRYVRLNVGGQLFHTTIETLTKHDCMLRAMFSGRMALVTDVEGYVLIDRPGHFFELVLNFLRDNTVVLPNDQHQVQLILQEARYYCLQGLIQECTQWLEYSGQMDNVESVPVCRVPIISTAKEERALLNASTHPVIKLLLNRHNNKYSYTSMSDDNLLKNLELFDKLLTRFSERIVFIKDVGAANEVCSWTFYGNRRKVAEVCCTSIVYATDKKHTKVEFPEARIFEEAMNILLFESGLSSSSTLTEPLVIRPTVIHHSSSSEPSSPTPDERASRTTHTREHVARARRELNREINK